MNFSRYKKINMNFSKFWKESFAGFVLKNIILALIIVVALAWIALIYMDFYTHHGDFETVPNLKGLYIEEAEMSLSNHGLYPQIIDSVYVRNKKLGTIIEQIPAANSRIKKNRPIYIIINSRQVYQVPLPDVNDVSYRQADAMLKSIGLSVSSVQYSPSEYKDLVIDVKYRGRSVLAGIRIPEGSSLVLIVGNGLGGDKAATPSLKGLDLEAAKQEALNNSMVIGGIVYDIEPMGDDDQYIIYRQHPAAGKTITTGTRIDIWLSKDKTMLDKVFEEDVDTEPIKTKTKTTIKTEVDEEFF